MNQTSDSSAVMPKDTAQFSIQVAEGCRLTDIGVNSMGERNQDLVVEMLIAGSRKMVRTEVLKGGVTWKQFLEDSKVMCPAGSWVIAVVMNNGSDVLAGEVDFTMKPEAVTAEPKAIQPVTRLNEQAITSPGNDTPSETIQEQEATNSVVVHLQRQEAERLLTAARGGYSIQAYELPGIERALRVALGELEA